MRFRIILITLALLLVYSSAANAFIPYDVTQDHPAYQDIKRIVMLDIMRGYPDGTFHPEITITRAEVARVAVVTMGLENAADLLKNAPSEFIDVKAGAWYTGWINIAASQMYMEGDDNGLFRPNDEITYVETITTLLRLVGYNDNLPGERPVDYITKAAALGMFENMQFSVSDLITRGDLAILLSRTLDQRIVKYDGDNFINHPEQINLLFEMYFKPAILEYGLKKHSKYDYVHDDSVDIFDLVYIARLLR